MSSGKYTVPQELRNRLRERAAGQRRPVEIRYFLGDSRLPLADVVYQPNSPYGVMVQRSEYHGCAVSWEKALISWLEKGQSGNVYRPSRVAFFTHDGLGIRLCPLLLHASKTYDQPEGASLVCVWCGKSKFGTSVLFAENRCVR